MTYKYYCNLVGENKPENIICKDYDESFCKMEVHGCPHQRENIFNLEKNLEEG